MYVRMLKPCPGRAQPLCAAQVGLLFRGHLHLRTPFFITHVPVTGADFGSFSSYLFILHYLTISTGLMRLLYLSGDSEFSLAEFGGSNIPPYAILSHT